MGAAERSAMNPPVYLGIDLGTQSIRVMAVTVEGQLVASSSTSLASYRDGTHHEQHPEEWWKAVVNSCKVVVQQLNRAAILGLAVDATSGTIVAVNSQLQAIQPALMYDDGRAIAEATEANKIGASCWQKMSYQMQPSWALPKAMWLSRYGNIPRKSRIIHQNDFINTRLAGRFLAADSSNALKTGYDLIQNEWPKETLEKLKLDPSLFPEVVTPGTLIGETGHATQEETGIPKGVPIYAGMTDGCAAQIASGTVTVGNWNSVIGTTLVIKGVTKHLIHDPLGVIYSHRSPDGMWLPGGASNTGAGIITKEFDSSELPQLNRAALQSGPTGISVYPLPGKGERFPFSNPQAEGFSVGQPISREMRYRSVLEGIACIERLAFDVLASKGAPVEGRLAISGGTTKSEAFNQIRADILQRPLVLPSVPESAFGMAVLAAAAHSSLDQAVQQMVHISRVIEPQRSFSAYAEQYSVLIAELERRNWLSREFSITALKGAYS